eukprot:22017_1
MAATDKDLLISTTENKYILQDMQLASQNKNKYNKFEKILLSDGNDTCNTIIKGVFDMTTTVNNNKNKIKPRRTTPNNNKNKITQPPPPIIIEEDNEFPPLFNISQKQNNQHGNQHGNRNRFGRIKAHKSGRNQHGNYNRHRSRRKRKYQYESESDCSNNSDNSVSSYSSDTKYRRKRRKIAFSEYESLFKIAIEQAKPITVNKGGTYVKNVNEGGLYINNVNEGGVVYNSNGTISRKAPSQPIIKCGKCRRRMKGFAYKDKVNKTIMCNHGDDIHGGTYTVSIIDKNCDKDKTIGSSNTYTINDKKDTREYSKLYHDFKFLYNEYLIYNNHDNNDSDEIIDMNSDENIKDNNNNNNSNNDGIIDMNSNMDEDEDSDMDNNKNKKCRER